MDPETALEEMISKHDLQVSDMTSKCAYAVRVRIAAQLVDWKMIAHYLGYSQVKIHTIHANNENEEQRRAAFLEDWTAKDGDGATYLKLAKAFYEHARPDLVEQLCKMVKRTKRRGREKSSAKKGYSATLTSDIQVREEKRFSLAWKELGQAPRKMSRWSDAIADGNKVYFMPGETYTKNIMVYQTTDNSWSEFRSHARHTNCALTIIEDQLTTVGGGGFPYTNKIYSFTDEGRYGLWTELIPPMPTRRQWTASLHTGTDLIVAGGWGSANVALKKVEIFNLQTQNWITAADLPEPLFHASMTLCGDQVYILSGYDESKQPSSAVYTCSLNALLRSSTTSQETSKIAVWKTIADLPVTESTCVSLHGQQLLAIGGRDTSFKSATAVFKYNLILKCWEVISHMLTPRHLCFAAVISDNRLIVVGGENSTVPNGSVEVAMISIH